MWFTQSTKILDTFCVSCLHRLWYCVTFCSSWKEDCMESLGDTWWIHCNNHLWATQCTLAKSNGWRDRSFCWVLPHPPLWHESNGFFYQRSQKEPVHSQSMSNVLQPKQLPHDNIWIGQYCKVDITGTAPHWHIDSCPLLLSGDGLAEQWKSCWSNLPETSATFPELLKCSCQSGCKDCKCVHAYLKCTHYCTCRADCDNA